MSINLGELFPPTTARHVKRAHTGASPTPGKGGTRRNDKIKTKWKVIYTLEMRGLSLREIATALNISQTAVSDAVGDERYIAYCEEHLNAMDVQFLQMKPLAFAALKAGLGSDDENTALRASEQWFKGAGFGGFAKEPVQPTRLTAEDVAQALIAGVNVNVQVNVSSAEGGGSTAQSTQSPLILDE